MIFGDDARVAAWVADRLPHVESFGPCAAIGVERGGRLILGVIYHGYTTPDIQVSAASVSPLWADVGVLAALYAYPFLQLKVRRLTCICPASLGRVHRTILHMGFVEEGRHRYGFGLEASVTFGMVREECRWLPLEDRRQL